MSNYLALFASARKVVMADDICRTSSLPATVIHVPKQYSSECGMCLRIGESAIAQFQSLMQEAAIKYQLYPDEPL